jgi:DinB family protein
VSDLRYPIGKYATPGEITEPMRRAWIDEVARAPRSLREAARGLTPSQLETPYRPGGWTVRQVIHHVPDSHLNAYVRFKLALTEDGPTIKPYHEDRWATLSDTATVPIEVSLNLLDSLHERWVALLMAMTPAEYGRSFNHPEYNRRMTLEDALGLYAWHGRHHAAHVTELRKREGWS